MLLRKMLRDMRARKGQFLSIFIMSLLGVFIYAGINAEWVGLRSILDEYYAETNMADYWAYGEGLNDDNVDDLLATSGVSGASLRLVANGTVDMADSPVLTLNIADSFDISGFKIIKGEEFEEGGSGIWLDNDFAEENGLDVGDTLTVTAYGITITQEIRALVISPEYIYTASADNMMPDHKGSGFAFLTTAALPAGMGVPYNEIIITADESDSMEATIETVLGGSATEVISRSSFASHVMIDHEIQQHRSMGQVFPIAFLAIATLTIITTMTRLVMAQRGQIGTLTALGSIVMHYMSYGFWLSTLGAVLGIILGPIFLAPLFFSVNEGMYVLPRWGTALSPAIFLMAAACVIVCTLASFLACRRTLSHVPAESLRPKGPAAFKASIWEKTRLWARTGFNFQWNFRDVFRSRLRSIMVIIGVGGCGMLLMGAFGLFDSFKDLINWQYEDIYAFETRITPESGADTSELTQRYDAELVYEEAIEIRFVDIKETATLIGTDKDDTMIRYYDNSRTEISLPDKGVSISYKMAETLGVEIGDTISWHIYGETTWYEREIAAIHRVPFGQGIAMTTEVMDDLGLNLTPSYLVTNKRVSSEDSGVLAVSTIGGLRADYEDMLDMFYTMIVLLVIAATILVVVVLYNLGILSYTERERDMATLKVLGFKTKKLRRIMLTQNLWLAGIGAVLGLPLAMLLLRFMLGTLSTEMDMMTIIAIPSLIIGIGGTFILSAILSYLFSGQVKRLDMVSALKAVE